MADARAPASGGVLAAIDRLADALARLAPWSGASVAIGLGVVSVAAFAPIYAVPLLWLAFPGILWLLDGARTWRHALWLGWAFGLGHFAAGVYWIGHAFLVDAERFGLLMPFAIGGLAAALAVFPALALTAVWASKSRGLARVLLLAGAWLVGEWLRSWVFSGFPWNLLGSVWAFSPETLQFAAVTGVWGLGVLTVTAATAPALLAGGAARRGRWRVALGLALVLPALLWGFGAARLSAAPEVGAAGVEGTRLRIVQPSIEQSLKWDPARRAAHVAGQIAMSDGAVGEGVTHVVWSETAIPFLLPDSREIREAVARIVPPGGLLLTGAPRGERVDGALRRLWNSLFVIDERGEVVAHYDKRHLVPFGEYVPLRGVLPLDKLVQGAGDFSSGEGPRALTLPGLPEVSVLICYEAIFPGRVVDPGTDPQWLLNVTNDAWFGTSIGPYQHLAAARLRAVEEGLPLVRAANSGISALIDPYGRIPSRLELKRVGVLDVPLPKALENQTLFARTGNWMVLILGCIAFSLHSIFRRVSLV